MAAKYCALMRLGCRVVTQSRLDAMESPILSTPKEKFLKACGKDPKKRMIVLKEAK